MADNRQSIAQQFVSVLGRQATPEELDHFSKFVDDGHLDPTEVAQVLQATPEFQNTLLQKQGGQYGDLLAANDSRTLSQAAGSLNATLAGMGRQGSSALESGLAQQAGNLAAQRQSALAAFYGRGLQNNASLAQSQGADMIGRGYGLRDESRHRNQMIEDYYRQQNDYNTAKKSAGGWNAITPEFGVNAALGLGGKLGAAMIGGSMGGGLFGGSSGGGVSVLERQKMGPSWNGW